MRDFLIGFLFFLSAGNLFSQQGQWTWMTGSNSTSPSWSYGTKGVASPTNTPPGLYEPCEWTDLNGNFWLYGGGSSHGVMGMLWKYDVAISQWTWISGDTMPNTQANLGVQGVPSPTNQPAAIAYCAASWVDASNNLWFCGGKQNNIGNDLWKYNISTNEWTWMKGYNAYHLPVYNTRLVADTSSTPGTRQETSVTWTQNNELWFYGGSLILPNGTGGGTYSDVWKFDISTNCWVWMKGRQTNNLFPVFGTPGVEDSSNHPGGRICYAKWKDLSGNIWFFGGGYDTGTPLNDLWKFNPVTLNWTWMGNGSVAGNYGTKCTASSTNWPPVRFENRACWTDSNGDFYMFGGCSSLSSNYNDLWKYCVASGQWIWISSDNGVNVSGNWGIKGVPDPANKPSARDGSVAWRSNNDLYLFGGWAYMIGAYWNDLWRFTIDATCAVCPQNIVLPAANFVMSDSSFCEGSCIDFINQSINATSFSWSFPGGNPSSSTSANPQNICYYTQGNYDVTLVADNGAGTDSVTITNAIVVFPPVQFSPITRSGDTLFSNQGYVSYQWYYDSTLIAGANNFYYVTTQSGDYSVQVVDSNGCSATAIMIDVISSTGELNPENFEISISENNIYLDNHLSIVSEAQVSLIDDIGRLIYSNKSVLTPGKNIFLITNSRLSTGIYFVNILVGEKVFSEKIYIK
jgi:hypothetical protein